MYQIGVSKVDMTFSGEGCGMLGYGMHFHNIEGVETNQYARAFVIEQNGKKLVFINAEFCFSTIMLKARIVEKLTINHPELGFSEENIMITAQHTHSAAGGYTQHLAYNFSIPGFRQDVYFHYSEAIIEAIIQADQNKKPASIHHHKGAFDKDAPIAFNRSIKAYNQNPEVEEKIDFKNRHLAADRTMKLLDFKDITGKTFGSINWFGVHTTSVSNRYRKVCADNKGYAATYLEDYLQSGEEENPKEPIVTAFAQDAAGDISPNYIWELRHREYRGKYKDDYESAAYNGKLQFKKAKEILGEIDKNKGQKIEGELDSILMYVDMSDIIIDEQYTGGLKRERTSQSAWGMDFLEGTTDGQGASKVVGQAFRLIMRSMRGIEVMGARLSKDPERQRNIIDYYNAHHPKCIVINHSTGVVAGAKHPEKLVLPGFVDPAIKYIKYSNKVGYGKKTPWVPTILPLQIFLVGSLAIVGLPAEITTIAGERLKNTVLEVLQERGIKEVLMTPYANSYAGYVTTYEEYRLQFYEGGHTLFGKWTLAAYQMKYKELATELLKAPKDRKKYTLRPEMFSMDEIWTGMDDKGVLEDLKALHDDEKDIS
jgi:neutral ceramidase